MLFQPHELESGSRQVVISSARPQKCELRSTKRPPRPTARLPPLLPLTRSVAHSLTHTAPALSLSLSLPKDYPLGNS